MNIFNFQVKIAERKAQQRAELQRAEAERAAVAAAARNAASSSSVPAATVAQQKIDENIQAQTAFQDAPPSSQKPHDIKYVDPNLLAEQEKREAEVKENEQTIAALTEKNGELSNKEGEKNSLLEKNKAEIERLVAENAQLGPELQQEKGKNNQISQNFSKLQEELRSAKESLGAKETEIASIKDTEGKKQATLTQEKESSEKQLKGLQEEHQKINEEIEQKNKKITDLEEENEKLKENQAQLNSLQGEKEKLEAELKSLSEIQSKLEKTQGELQEKIEVISNQQTNISSINEKNKKLKEELKEKENVEKKLSDLNEQYQKITFDIGEKEKKIKELEGNEARLIALQGEKEKLEAELNGLPGIKAELEDIKKKLTDKEKELEPLPTIKKSLEDAQTELSQIKHSRGDTQRELIRLKELNKAAASGTLSEVRKKDASVVSYDYYKKVREIVLRNCPVGLPELSADSSHMLIIQNETGRTYRIALGEEEVELGQQLEKLTAKYKGNFWDTYQKDAEEGKYLWDGIDLSVVIEPKARKKEPEIGSQEESNLSESGTSTLPAVTNLQQDPSSHLDSDSNLQKYMPISFYGHFNEVSKFYDEAKSIFTKGGFDLPEFKERMTCALAYRKGRDLDTQEYLTTCRISSEEGNERVVIEKIDNIVTVFYKDHFHTSPWSLEKAEGQ